MADNVYASPLNKVLHKQLVHSCHHQLMHSDCTIIVLATEDLCNGTTAAYTTLSVQFVIFILQSIFHIKWHATTSALHSSWIVIQLVLAD